MILPVLFSMAIAQTGERWPLRPSDQCTGARRNEVCTTEGRARLRGELGLASVEDETAAGVEIYRAFYLEGGGGLPAIAFVRRPGHNPAVEVSNGGGQRMTADVPLSLWSQVQGEAAIADRVLEPRPGEEGQDICMEGGAVLVETGMLARSSREPAVVRSRAETSCGSGVTNRFAQHLAEWAVPMFPGCAAIDPDAVPDGGIWRLYYCAKLTGDEIAAAQVFNKYHGEPDEGASVAEWREVTGLSDHTRVDWNGEVFETGALAALISRFAALGRPYLHLTEISGVSSREVRTRGELSVFSEPASQAVFTQVWRYNVFAGEWRLSEWIFGPIELLSRP